MSFGTLFDLLGDSSVEQGVLCVSPMVNRFNIPGKIFWSSLELVVASRIFHRSIPYL
eukprot:jgi/Psemu1/307564/fgenesh1_kg.338_\